LNLNKKIPESKQKDYHCDVPVGQGIPIGEIELNISRQGYKRCNDTIKGFITFNSQQPS
jgi:hypothetical protein